MTNVQKFYDNLSVLRGERFRICLLYLGDGYIQYDIFGDGRYITIAIFDTDEYLRSEGLESRLSNRIMEIIKRDTEEKTRRRD